LRKLAISFLILMVAASLAAQQSHRNRIPYRPFEWRKIEVSDNRYKIYFPKEMAEKARFVASKLEKIFAFYRERVFNVDYPVAVSDSASSWIKNILIKIGFVDNIRFLRDPDGKILTVKTAWRPNEVIIVLYPNMQDYNQQRVVDAFIPPGVLGLTETLGYRIAYPYNGNIHNFILVTAHELAHAWMFNFMAYWRAVASKTKVRPIGKDMKIPKLWFIEGFAELLADAYLESIGQNDDYRRAQVNEFNMKSVVGDNIPTLSGPFEVDGWENYSFGFHFLKFVADEYSFSYLVELIKLLAEGEKTFEEAWQTVFNETLDETELRWRKSIKVKYHELALLTRADDLVKSPIVIPYPLSNFNYDAASNRLIGYEADEKWGLRTVVIDLDSLEALEGIRREWNKKWYEHFELKHREFEEERADSLNELRVIKVDSLEKEIYALRKEYERLEKKVKVEIDHQFKDKALFYRLDNVPALKGNRIAISISRDGQDIIRLFEVNLADEEPKVDLIKEFRFESILWVNDLSFADKSNLLFVGMDVEGEKNIYSLSIKTGALQKLTDTREEKFSPKMIGETLFYIKADSLDRRNLYIEKNGECFRLELDEKGFVDQFVVSDSLVAIRVLNSKGFPEIVIWSYGADRAYRYRYGSIVQKEDGPSPVAYPLAQKLIELTKEGDFIILDSESRKSGKIKLQKVRLDLAKLSVFPVAVKNLEITAKSGGISEANDSLYTIKEADRVLRFPTYFRDRFYADGYRLGVANATGEYAASGILYSSHDNHFGFMYLAEFDYYDFSKRMQKLFTFETGRFYRFRNYFYINREKGENAGLILDQYFEARRLYLWPFDLENSVSFGFGGGYLRREYISFLSNETKVLRTPFYKFIGQFVSDGAFIDPFRSSRQGHFFQLRGEFSGDKRALVFDGTFISDFRYYLRPWQGSPYFASRIAYGKTFGRDASWFFLPDLYRSSGFQHYNIAQSFGNEFVMYQMEFRFPFFRWAIFDYKFWENPVPFFLVSVNAFGFLYGGDTRWVGESFHFVHRIGYGLKFSISFLPFQIRWERYAYINYSGLLVGNWRNAWTIEIEY